MISSSIATFIILAMLLIIMSSLGFGLFYLLFEANGSKHTLIALSLRVAVSMFLFMGLLGAIHLGWIIPNPPSL